jgi:hypothetical protein
MGRRAARPLESTVSIKRRAGMHLPIGTLTSRRGR